MATAPAPPKPRPLAAGYVRVSSAKQAEADKTSLAEQASAIAAYCEKAGLELVKTYSDIASGTSRVRPEWKRLLRSAETGQIEHIVCWSGDRLARGGAPMGDLLDAAPASKVTIHTANGTTFDRRYAELLASIARLERDAFQERATTGKKGRARSGRLPVSRTPYGYHMARTDDGRPSGVLEEDPITAATVRRIFELAAGPEGQGTRKISDLLNREATPSPAGNHWWPGAISRILADRAYVGIYLYGARRGRGRTNDDNDAIEVQIPPIIPTGLFNAVQRSASKRSKGFVRRKHVYALSGLLTCKVCERSMGGTARISGHGKKLAEPRRYYRCAIGRDNSRPNCRTKSHQPAADLEAVVWDAVTQMLTDPFSFCDAFNEDVPEDDGLDAEIRDAERTLKALDLEDERLLSAYVKGIFKAENLESEKTGIDARRVAAQAHLEGLTNRRALRADRSTVELSVKSIQDAIDGDLDALDDTGRKALVQRCVEAVELDASGFVRIGFNFVKVESEAELAALRIAPRLTLQVV